MKVYIFNLFFFFFTGSGVALLELSDAESVGDGHDHTTLQESATDTLSFSCSQTRT